MIKAFLESRSDRRGTTLRYLKTRMKRVLVRPRRGVYALAPKQLDLLISLKSTGGKESKSINKTSVVNVPYIFQKGKKLYPKEKGVENYQMPLFAIGLN